MSSSKGRGRPKPDASVSKSAKHIYCELERALSLESKYKSNLPSVARADDRQPDAVSLASRDKAVHTLRCLKVWFDLPSIVFLSAVNVMDRFLSTMLVREKFLACVSISCLKIATEIHRCPPISIANLAQISQSKCKVQDVERMSGIIRKKLELENLTEPVTAYNFLTLYLKFIDLYSSQFDEIKPLASRMLQKKILVRRLEVAMTNSKCAERAPSVMALGLVQSEIERFMGEERPDKSLYYSFEMLQFITLVLVHLQNLCSIASEEYASCYEELKNTLHNYDGQSRCPRHAVQNLEWRFSTSTLNSPRLLHMFYTDLHPVREE